MHFWKSRLSRLDSSLF